MLTDEQQRILDFERLWFRAAGTKEEAIRARFDLSPVAYHQRLNAVLNTEAAEAYAPAVVHRLRHLRDRAVRRRR